MMRGWQRQPPSSQNDISGTYFYDMTHPELDRFNLGYGGHIIASLGAEPRWRPRLIVHVRIYIGVAKVRRICASQTGRNRSARSVCMSASWGATPTRPAAINGDWAPRLWGSRRTHRLPSGRWLTRRTTTTSKSRLSHSRNLTSVSNAARESARFTGGSKDRQANAASLF
jgi:hypothetical protein